MSKFFPAIFLALCLGHFSFGQDTNRLEPTGNVGVGITTPNSLLEIRQVEESGDRGLLITEPNNTQKIQLHLADNQNGEYGYFSLGGNTYLRGNGQSSRFDGNLDVGLSSSPASLNVYGMIRTSSTDSRGLNMFLSGDGNAYYNYTGGASSSRIGFQIDGSSRMSIMNNGSVGIGTVHTGSFKLAVNGAICAKEIKVETGWSDFVFEEDYPLRSLAEVEAFIKENGHLPDIPSAKEVEENGVNVGEMEARLLQKIEELTLYVIQQQKELEELKKENEEQKEEIENMKNFNKSPNGI